MFLREIFDQGKPLLRKSVYNNISISTESPVSFNMLTAKLMNSGASPTRPKISICYINLLRPAWA